jgi:hypothetical protein
LHNKSSKKNTSLEIFYGKVAKGPIACQWRNGNSSARSD